MPEENAKVPQQEESAVDVKKYLDAIENLKQTHVPRELYEEAKSESATLLQAILDGSQASGSKADPKPEKPDVKALARDTFSEDCDLSDLQVVKNILAIREATLTDKGIDLFVPQGSQYKPTLDDISRAKNLAECLQHCVDVAEEDSTIFMRELARITR